MKLQHKKKPPAIKGRFKQGVAVVLAALMSFTAPMPGMSFLSHAGDPPLKSVSLPENGGGLSVAYSTFNIKDVNSPGRGFDIEGIEDPNLVGSPKPYTGDRTKAVSTTYAAPGSNSHVGYQTFVRPYSDSNNEAPFSFWSTDTGKNGGGCRHLTTASKESNCS